MRSFFYLRGDGFLATYGYVRVSTAEQNEDRQIIAMNELKIPSCYIYTDKVSEKILSVRHTRH